MELVYWRFLPYLNRRIILYNRTMFYQRRTRRTHLSEDSFYEKNTLFPYRIVRLLQQCFRSGRFQTAAPRTGVRSAGACDRKRCQRTIQNCRRLLYVPVENNGGNRTEQCTRSASIRQRRTERRRIFRQTDRLPSRGTSRLALQKNTTEIQTDLELSRLCGSRCLLSAGGYRVRHQRQRLLLPANRYADFRKGPFFKQSCATRIFRRPAVSVG